MSDTPPPSSPASTFVVYGQLPLSRLWDCRPLSEGAWGNILGFHDQTSDGCTIEMRLWINPFSMETPQRYRPAWAPLPIAFRDGGTRRCYIPSRADVAIVQKHFPEIDDPYNPNWFAVAGRLLAKGHQRANLESLSPLELLALLDTTEAALTPGTSREGEGEEPPTAEQNPVEEGKTLADAVGNDPVIALARVLTDGVADARIKRAAQLLSDDRLTINEKLTKIDALVPFPPTASAERLGEMLGVTKQAILKTAWWIQNRKGEKESEIGRRRERHHERARDYESSSQDDGE